MSLDIYIVQPEPKVVRSTGIYVRDNGETRELSLEEAKAMYPDADIKVNTYETDEFWHGNITHNLNKMAMQCPSFDPDYSLYNLLWRDEPINDLNPYFYIDRLISCLGNLENNPDYYKQFNPENGWGTYEQLVKFVKSFVIALIDMPNGSKIEYSR